MEQIPTFVVIWHVESQLKQKVGEAESRGRKQKVGGSSFSVAADRPACSFGEDIGASPFPSALKSSSVLVSV
jgi:hypothetical protein